MILTVWPALYLCATMADALLPDEDSPLMRRQLALLFQHRVVFPFQLGADRGLFAHGASDDRGGDAFFSGERPCPVADAFAHHGSLLSKTANDEPADGFRNRVNAGPISGVPARDGDDPGFIQ